MEWGGRRGRRRKGLVDKAGEGRGREETRGESRQSVLTCLRFVYRFQSPLLGPRTRMNPGGKMGLGFGLMRRVPRPGNRLIHPFIFLSIHWPTYIIQSIYWSDQVIQLSFSGRRATFCHYQLFVHPLIDVINFHLPHVGFNLQYVMTVSEKSKLKNEFQKGYKFTGYLTDLHVRKSFYFCPFHFVKWNITSQMIYFGEFQLFIKKKQNCSSLMHFPIEWLLSFIGHVLIAALWRFKVRNIHTRTKKNANTMLTLHCNITHIFPIFFAPHAISIRGRCHTVRSVHTFRPFQTGSAIHPHQKKAFLARDVHTPHKMLNLTH